MQGKPLRLARGNRGGASAPAESESQTAPAELARPADGDLGIGVGSYVVTSILGERFTTKNLLEAHVVG
jgi:hypothetical protein